MPEDPNPSASKEREFETGTDEFFKAHSELTATNAKRTYDAYQHPDLAHIHNSQQIFQQSAANLQGQLATLNQLTVQALQNAIQATHQTSQNSITTADMQAKQYLKHSDLAADSYWNPVSAGAGMNLTAGAVPANRATDVAAAATGVAAAGQAVAAEAVGAAVGIAVNAALTPLLATLTSIANVLAQTQPKDSAVSK